MAQKETCGFYVHNISDAFEVFNNQIVTHFPLKEMIEIRLPKDLFYKFLFEFKIYSLDDLVFRENKNTKKIIGFSFLNFRVRIKQNARN